MIWLLVLSGVAFAEDKVDAHFYDKGGNACSTAKWIEEIKSGTVIKTEEAVSVGGVKYTIETRYSGLDTRDPETTPDFKPQIYETITIGLDKDSYYDGFIAKYEKQADAKSKNDDVTAKIKAGALLSDLAIEGVVP